MAGVNKLSRRTPRWVAPAVAGGLVMAATAGAVASATIPGDGNVYKACMLKNVGTLRLIDPSLPSSNLMSRCTSLETPVAWNQQGQPGPQGAPGGFAGTLASPDGSYSISVTDAGIVLQAPGATARLVGNDIMLDSGGDTTLRAAGNLAVSIGSDTSLRIGRNVAVAVGGGTSFQGAGDVTVESARSVALRGGSAVSLNSSGPVTVNGTPIP